MSAQFPYRPATCHCPHEFPLCACSIPGMVLRSPALLLQARRLSSIAGWPAVIDAGSLAIAQAELARLTTLAATSPGSVMLAARMPAPGAGACKGCGKHAAQAQ